MSNETFVKVMRVLAIAAFCFSFGVDIGYHKGFGEACQSLKAEHHDGKCVNVIRDRGMK